MTRLEYARDSFHTEQTQSTALNYHNALWSAYLYGGLPDAMMKAEGKVLEAFWDRVENRVLIALTA